MSGFHKYREMYDTPASKSIRYSPWPILEFDQLRGLVRAAALDKYTTFKQTVGRSASEQAYESNVRIIRINETFRAVWPSPVDLKWPGPNRDKVMCLCLERYASLEKAYSMAVFNALSHLERATMRHERALCWSSKDKITNAIIATKESVCRCKQAWTLRIAMRKMLRVSEKSMTQLSQF